MLLPCGSTRKNAVLDGVEEVLGEFEPEELNEIVDVGEVEGDALGEPETGGTIAILSISAVLSPGEATQQICSSAQAPGGVNSTVVKGCQFELLNGVDGLHAWSSRLMTREAWPYWSLFRAISWNCIRGVVEMF